MVLPETGSIYKSPFFSDSSSKDISSGIVGNRQSEFLFTINPIDGFGVLFAGNQFGDDALDAKALYDMGNLNGY
ncbi:MAG: hypothetical protein V2B19_32320 [Pseudomonadota bacterium]